MREAISPEKCVCIANGLEGVRRALAARLLDKQFPRLSRLQRHGWMVKHKRHLSTNLQFGEGLPVAEGR